MKKGSLYIKRHPSGSHSGALKCKLCAGWGSSSLRARKLGSAPLTKLGLATGCGLVVWRGLQTPGVSISVANSQGSSSGPRTPERMAGGP